MHFAGGGFPEALGGRLERLSPRPLHGIRLSQQPWKEKEALSEARVGNTSALAIPLSRC